MKDDIKTHRASIDVSLLSSNSYSFLIDATGSHAINTNCSAAHSRQALSCKMAVEYDKFIESGKK